MPPPRDESAGPPAPPRHFRNVQALRGVACLMVVLFHLQHWDAAFGAETPVLREVRWFGFAGVDLFFVLSGFVITATNRRHLGRPAAVPGYLFRRAWRIYPAYWAAMGVTLAVGYALFNWTGGGLGTGPDWAAWLTLAPSGPGNPVIGQAWTLTYEVMFYAAFGALMFVPPRAAAVLLGAWAGWSAAALFGPPPADPLAVAPASPFVLEFLGGCLVAWLAGRGVRCWWGAACGLGLAWAVVGIAVAAATVPVPYGQAVASPWVRVPVFGPAAVLVLYGLVAAEGRWPRRVPGWLLRTGDASYSLYLLHYTVMLVAVAVGMRMPHTRLPHLLWLAGTLAASLAAGFAFHALVERPLLNLPVRRKAAPPVAPPAAVPPARRAA